LAKAPKILCGGIAVQDILMRVETFPAPGTKASASEFVITGGGCAANAAVAIARLGGTVGFSGPVGDHDDAVTQRIIADLESEAVDCSHVVRVTGATASVSLILIDGVGEKMIATRRGRNLATARPDAQAAVADIDLLLVDNRFLEFVQALCEAAKTRKIPIVIDADKATRMDDPLLATGTHIIFSTEALRGTTGIHDVSEALHVMRARLPGFLSATDGPAGAYWFEAGALMHMPAFAITPVDTLGAGDTFHGAYALMLAEGADTKTAIRFASAAAALKCQKFGGNAGTPTRTEVQYFLAQQG
jgi:sulfofructose kinase